MTNLAVVVTALFVGIFLMFGLSFVVYRYYSRRRKYEDWESWESTGSVSSGQPLIGKNVVQRFSITHQEFSAPKDQSAQQPLHSSAQATSSESLRSRNESNASSHPLQHQPKSYPTNQTMLCRTPSISSQSSVDSSGNSKQSHRGSSPQIRAFAPDGKAAFHQEAVHTSSYPLKSTSRSPSPLRAASLDIRSSSPNASVFTGDIRTPSPSQSSLVSCTGSSCNNSPVPASPRTNLGRSLSPLMLPSRGHTPDTNIAGVAPPPSPLGAIQPDLYLRRDGPLFIGENPRPGQSFGRLHFWIKYDFDKSDLVVHLIEAHELAGLDQGGFSDPYVRLCLLPEVDSRKRQTTVHRNDLNPFFDQHFKFPIAREELEATTLLFQVFDYDHSSKSVGEVRLVMAECDLSSNVEVWGELTRAKKPAEEVQEILVSLSYLPHAERLTVVLSNARNLPLPQDKDHIDPFVKVYLLVNGKRTKKKKTGTKKCTTNPSWNEALTFSLSSTNLPNAAIEVCIMDQSNELMGTSPVLGSFIIGPKQSGIEFDHWHDMIRSPRKAISAWHTMR